MDIVIDFLASAAAMAGDGVVWIIGLFTDWRPGDSLKKLIDGVSGILGLLLTFSAVYALLFRGGSATAQDVKQATQTLVSGQGEIAAEVAALRKAMQAKTAGGPDAAAMTVGDGFDKDLNAGVDTLLRAGRADALQDASGQVAEAALDDLIAQRQAAREKIRTDEADLWRQKGAFAFLHDTQAAIDAYREATVLAPDDPDGWNQLGHLLRRIGALDDAAEAYRRVEAIGHARQDQSWLARAAGNLGIVFRTRGDLDQAEEHHRKALDLNQALGRKEGMAANYGNLGNVFRTRGDLDQAEAHYRKALDLNQALGRKEGMAADYGNLGVLEKKRQNMPAAIAHWRRSLALFREIGAAPQVEKLSGWLREAGALDDAAE
ncbi:MAG: tetratricopeptide repeat protein [Pseudomonadota bacterium]